MATLRKKYATKIFKGGRINLQLLWKMLADVDKMWFSGKLIPGLSDTYANVELAVHDNSDGNRGIAGFVLLHRNGTIEMSFNEPLFAGIFKKNEYGYHAGGMLCRSRFDCFMHIMLHETVHLALSLCETLGYWNDSDPHSARFQEICASFFGHTNHNHGILIGFNQTLPLAKIKDNVKVNQKVRVFVTEDDGTRKFKDAVILRKGKQRAEVLLAGKKMAVHYGLICATANC
jgi:hypothetical protein